MYISRVTLNRDAAYGTQTESESVCKDCYHGHKKVTTSYLRSGSPLDDCGTSDSTDAPPSYVSSQG